MMDFRNHTTVAKDFYIETVLAENETLHSNNELLVVVVITAAVLVMGLSVYNANEQYKNKMKYSIVVN